MDALIVVQCRYASSRLPGKAMYPLAGLPMLAFLLRRLKSAELKARLILAVTDRPEDDVLAAWGNAEEVPVVRGENDDVLARYLKCIEMYPAASVVRVTADNPLTAPEAVRDTLTALDSGCWDYVEALKSYPYGAGVDGFRADLLRLIHKESRRPRHLEHINAYVLDYPERFRCCHLPSTKELARHEVSFTVDYLEDYRRLEGLLNGVRPSAYNIRLADALIRFDRANL